MDEGDIAINLLKKYTSFSDFRPGQKQVVTAVLAKHDTVGILPTGTGKSLCYQLPGLYFSGITLIISPLIALIEDQVRSLKEKGISATYVASTIPKANRVARWAEILHGKHRFIFMAPETALQPKNLKRLTVINITLLVIDEAHCISEWGAQFRPEYRKIFEIRNILKKPPPCLALTATANHQTIKDIKRYLQLSDAIICNTGAYRPNLALFFFSTELGWARDLQLYTALKRTGNQSTIIYSATRREAEVLQQKISNWFPNREVQFYHAGLSALERRQRAAAFINNTCPWMVATSAFGMGIDKPNIRTVILYQPPSSPEMLLQMIGRAGRDTELANCYIWFHPKDIEILQNFTHNAHTRFKLKKVLELFEKRNCRWRSLLTLFSQTIPKNCGRCDFCTKTNLEPELETQNYYQQLLQFRNQYLKQKKLVPHQVWLNQTLAWIATLRPKTESEMAVIPGYTPALQIHNQALLQALNQMKKSPL